MTIFLLNKDLVFPHPNLAEKDGIIAIGGDLSPERILLAYSKGIFPWYNEGEPIVWWSPDPRMVLYPERLKVSKSMQKVLKQQQFKITFDCAFSEVIKACKEIKRHGQRGTWITPEIINAYTKLHNLGYAHSVEVWENEQLVGGLYGIAMGKCFFGESMFSKADNASKAGFITLVEKLKKYNFDLIDCQVYSAHLESLGAENISRKAFLNHLSRSLANPESVGPWLILN